MTEKKFFGGSSAIMINDKNMEEPCRDPYHRFYKGLPVEGAGAGQIG